MLKMYYDPTNVNGDAFSMGNMVETVTEKVLTGDERTKLAGVAPGAEVNVQSDWDESDTGADSFIVNKPVIGGAKKMTVTTGDHIENLDVSSLSPMGVLFVNNTANKELKSLAGGIDGDIVHLVHISTNDLKIKDPDSYAGQQIETPGGADRVIGDYGGCTLVYSSSLGYWVATGLYF